MQAPENYAETPEGLLFFADGVSPMKRWDGSSALVQPVGVTAPDAGPTLSGDAKTGVITDASNATPIVVTSVAHGLASGASVTVAGVLGNTAANGTFVVTVLTADTFSLGGSAGNAAYTSGGTWGGAIVGTYQGFVRFVNELGAVSDLSPVSVAVTLTAATAVTFSGVPVSTQANVARRQLLRNTDGQLDTFYVDIDTDDLTSTSFDSARADADLSSQEAQALFDDQGDILANLHGVPPSHKRVIAHHSGRMFAAVDRHYSEGNCRATNGGVVVRGVNTVWTASMAGRQLLAVGADRAYQIDSVDAQAQTLTLTEAWQGASDDFLGYTIRPQPAERRLVYYTEAGLPESWPAIDAVSLQEDGDEITGLLVMDSFLYILESRHIYKYTFQADPGVDGFVYQAGNRGCVNNRSWVIADGDAYMLDQQGIHKFGGDEEGQSVSDVVRELFSRSAETPFINWQASELFHCAHSPDSRTIRWFVCLSGQVAPRHAISFDYRSSRWWVEEYDRPVYSSASATLEGRRRVYLGTNGGTMLLGEGTLDALDPGAGLTRGPVTSADRYGLSDAANYLSWPDASLLVGQSVTIAEGTGAGQSRKIVASSGGRLQLLTPWLVVPGADSVYQLGGVGWQWQSGWLRYTEDEEDDPTKVEVLYRTTAAPSSLVLRLYENFKARPLEMHASRKGRDAEGFASKSGTSDLVADMSGEYGQVQQRMDRHKELNMIGPRYLSVGLSGVLAAERQSIYQVAIDGVDAPGGEG